MSFSGDKIQTLDSMVSPDSPTLFRDMRPTCARRESLCPPTRFFASACSPRRATAAVLVYYATLASQGASNATVVSANRRISHILSQGTLQSGPWPPGSTQFGWQSGLYFKINVRISRRSPVHHDPASSHLSYDFHCTPRATQGVDFNSRLSIIRQVYNAE